MISSIAWLPASAVKPVPRAKPLTEEEIAEARRIAAQGRTREKERVELRRRRLRRLALLPSLFFPSLTR
jgi:hypothetical protein